MQIGIMTVASGDLHGGRGRPTKFTVERIEQIKNLVERGKTKEEIAEIIGCTPGTLAVTCSRLGVSLRRPRFDMVGFRSKQRAAPEQSTVPVIASDETNGPQPTPEPKNDNGEQLPKPAQPVGFRIEMEYRGIKRWTDVPMDERTLGYLALEAEIRDMRVGELVSLLILRLVQTNGIARLIEEKGNRKGVENEA
jgi:hypothetical protein